MFLSIIIVNYNGKDLLINCVKSIIKNLNLRKKEYEIIIIDNNSDDSSMLKLYDYIRENNYELLIKTKLLDKNYGFAKANNIGVKMSSGKYLFFINNDTLIYDFDFEDFYSKYQVLSPAIFSPRLLNSDLTIQKSDFYFPNLFMLFLDSLNLKIIIKKIINKINNKERGKSNIKKVQYLSGACFFIEKKIFEDLGGFDEDYYFYHEECDLMYKAMKKNINCYIDLENSIIHYGGGNKPFSKMKYFNYYKSLITFFKKNRSQTYLPKIIVLFGMYFRKLLLDLGFEIFIDPISIYKKKNSFSKDEIEDIYLYVIDKLKED